MSIEELKEGDRLYFSREKRPYTIRCRGKRYIVCTKPFNAKKTVLYTIIDLIEKVRGTENLIFCMGFETDELCAEALIRLESGETEISRRNRVELDIIRITTKQ